MPKDIEAIRLGLRFQVDNVTPNGGNIRKMQMRSHSPLIIPRHGEKRSNQSS